MGAQILVCGKNRSLGMSIRVLEGNVGIEPGVGVLASVACCVDYLNLVRIKSCPHGSLTSSFMSQMVCLSARRRLMTA